MVFQSNYIDPKTKSEMKVAVKGIKGNVVYVHTFIYSYIINQLQIKYKTKQWGWGIRMPSHFYELFTET